MKDDFAQFKKLLLTLRGKLVGKVDSMQGEALKKSRQDASDLSNVPIHMADVGTDNYERDLMIELIENGEEGLRNIDTPWKRWTTARTAYVKSVQKINKGPSKGRSLRETLYRLPERRGN